MAVPSERRQAVFQSIADRLQELGSNPASARQRVNHGRLIRELNEEVFACFDVTEAQVQRLSELHF